MDKDRSIIESPPDKPDGVLDEKVADVDWEEMEELNPLHLEEAVMNDPLHLDEVGTVPVVKLSQSSLFSSDSEQTKG